MLYEHEARTRRHHRSYLIGTSAVGLVALVAGLSAPAPAHAADAAQAAQAPSVEEIVVTGTRIVRDGYEAPTPLTVVGAEAIQNTATANLVDTLNTMPVFAGSYTPVQGSGSPSSYGGGLNLLNLRSMGPQRLLVLIDGQRTVSSRTDGVIDINNVPQQLVARVDVVTAGASAVYGSDAISGVVNFVLDKTYTGVKGEVSGGVTTYGDDRNWKIALTAGVPFANDRGHLLLSGELNYKDEVLTGAGRPWNYAGDGIISNPNYTATNGQPERLWLGNVGTWYAPGNVIDSGPLKGIAFGPGGVPYNFNFGSLTGGIFTAGGDWQSSLWARFTKGLDPQAIRKNAFVRASYDLTDSVNVFVQTAWNESFDDNKGFATYQAGNGPTVLSGNPFIPASVQAQMTALKLTSIHIGGMNQDLPVIGSQSDKITTRNVVGGSGKFDAIDTPWSWSAYFQNGMTRINYNATGVTRRSLRAQAVDAVRAPNGAIVCRSTLTNPNDGCVPYDPMGIGVNSAAAMNYLTSGTRAHVNQHILQNVFAGSVTGEPLSDWAGPISLALSAEHRWEKALSVPDAITLLSDWQAGNFLPLNASYSVTEGAAETVIPLAKNTSFAKSLDLNAAFRATSYSNSGYVSTWKVGATWQPIDDIRVRATRSRDIRAPSLQELYNNVIAGFFTVNDLFTNSTPTFLLNQSGNPDLKPEKANTTDIGVVLQPNFFPGLSLSVDYWNIDLSDALATPSLNQIVQFCFTGNQSYCSKIVRTNGVITGMTQAPFNIAIQTTRGIDVEGSYRLNLADVVQSWDGSIGLHANATFYLKNYVDTKLSTPIDNVGENGSTAPPNWNLNAEVDYKTGPITTSLTARAFSSGTILNTYIECSSGCPASGSGGGTFHTINNNHLPGAFYMDAAFSYQFLTGDHSTAEAFLNIRNLANTNPATVPKTADEFGYVSLLTNTAKYDILGRVFRVGIRFKM